MSDEPEKNEESAEGPAGTILARRDDVIESDGIRVTKSEESAEAPVGVRVTKSEQPSEAPGGVNVVVNIEPSPPTQPSAQAEPMGFAAVNRWGVWGSWRLIAVLAGVFAVVSIAVLVLSASSAPSRGGSVDAIAHRYVIDNEKRLNEVVASVVAVRLPEEQREEAARDIREAIRWTYRPPVHLVDNLYEVSAVATAETERVRGTVPFGLIVRADAGDVARVYVQAMGTGVDVEPVDSTLSVN